MMKAAHALQASAGAEKARIALETDTKAAQLEFEVEVQNTRSIVADPKEITQ